MPLSVTLVEISNMLELEERVDSLEAMFGRFIINNDKTLRRLEQMMVEMRQQAAQDRERTDQILAEMRQQAEQDRQRTNQTLVEMRQQAEQDRKRTDQRTEQDRERTDQRAEQDRERTRPGNLIDQRGCTRDAEHRQRDTANARRRVPTGARVGVCHGPQPPAAPLLGASSRVAA